MRWKPRLTRCRADVKSMNVNWRRIPRGEGLLQPMHLLVIFGIALLVFGPKKLPELGKGLGEAIRGFKSSLIEGEQAGTALDSATKK
jgi:sec-independent protein translocase protein TatA